MVDFRFYLFSVVAVFLALGTGMLVGGALAGGGALAEKQQAMVRELEGQYRLLREREHALAQRVNELERKARRDDAFAASALPVLVAGRLQGKTVAVVTGQPEGYARAVVAVMRSAGATRVGVVPLQAGPGADLAARTASALGGWPDAVVFLAEAGDQPPGWERLLREAAQAWAGAGVTVVAGAPAAAPPSLAALFRRLGLPAVPNADEPAGQVELVSFLAGRLPGSGRGVGP